MPQIPYYQVDAFTTQPFSGNPAGVVPLLEWLPDPIMQAMAAEHGLSETAFFVARPGAREGEFDLRWFSPLREVDLCGHATLATGYVIFNRLAEAAAVDSLTFHTKAGPLVVEREAEGLALDLPIRIANPVMPPPPPLIQALGIRRPLEVLASESLYLVVLPDQNAVATLQPDLMKLAALDRDGVIVTAAATPAADAPDFVSRFFAPKLGIAEDPVTGAAHATLTPYWAVKLRKLAMKAWQISPRGGELWVEDRATKVRLRGNCVLYATAVIELPEPIAS